MRIACPNCAAEYEVPDALLAAGPRPLRCARCKHEWMVGGAAPPAEPPPAPAASERFSPMPPPAVPPAAEDPAAEPAVPRPPPARGLKEHTPIGVPLPRLADTPSSEGGRRGAILAWVASLLLVSGAAAAAVVYRERLVEAWPPAARLFMALGLG